jgi:hypothetical protein
MTKGQEFSKVFANKFTERMVTHDPNTNQEVISKELLDLSEFDWLGDSVPEEKVYQFRSLLFYRGLVILPIYGYGAVERVAVPPAEEIVTFTESNIDPVRIDSLLSQLHWQTGERVRHVDGIYQLEDIQLHNGCASAFRLQAEHGTIAQWFPVNELHRTFFTGDGVVILAGLHKGQTGFVLREENGLLHVLVTADDDDVSGSAMPYILPEFILFARS